MDAPAGTLDGACGGMLDGYRVPQRIGSVNLSEIALRSSVKRMDAKYKPLRLCILASLR